MLRMLLVYVVLGIGWQDASQGTHGAFEMYALRWIGANEDPSLYTYAFASTQIPPVGGNRGHYRNAEVDRLLDEAAQAGDEAARRALYVQVQQILSRDVPAIPLWFPDNNIVHTERVENIRPSGSGSFDFLRTATLR